MRNRNFAWNKLKITYLMQNRNSFNRKIGA